MTLGPPPQSRPLHVPPILEGYQERKKGPHRFHEISIPRDETHLLEVAYFDELAKDGEVTPPKPRGVPLLALGDHVGKRSSLTIPLIPLLVTLDHSSRRG